MNSKTIVPDIKSGVVVFLVALPLCLGIALACKAPLFSGLLAGIIGGIIVTALSGSTLSVSGPAAGLTAIVLSSVASLGSFELFIAAVFLAGIVQIILGILKAGKIANYIPNAVIRGMLAGIGIILIIKQVPHLVGYDADPEGEFDFYQPDGHTTFSDLLYMLDYITPGSILVGIVSLLILYMAERKFYKQNKLLSFIPGALLAVIFGVCINLIFSGQSAFFKINPEHLVNLPVITNYSELKGILVSPDFSMIASSKFWLVVATIAMVASLESLLSIEATDKLDPGKRYSNTNKELIAQGVGNMVCGFLGALPVTAVIVRSSANINSGAKTKLSAIIHAVLLLLCVLYIPTVLSLIPNASLAAILIMTGYKLASPALFKDYFKKGYDQAIPFMATIAVMLLTDLLKGIAAGMVVAVFFIIKSNIRSFNTSKDTLDDKMHHLIRLPEHVTFFNKGFLIDYFRRVNPNSKVIIDGSFNKTMDNDVKEVITEFIETGKEKKIETSLINLTL